MPEVSSRFRCQKCGAYYYIDTASPPANDDDHAAFIPKCACDSKRVIETDESIGNTR